MKKLLFGLLILSCAACGNSAEDNNKLDSLKTQIDTTADKIADSVKAKASRLEDKIEEKLNSKDSFNH
jgi:hypothetical protein